MTPLEVMEMCVRMGEVFDFVAAAAKVEPSAPDQMESQLLSQGMFLGLMIASRHPAEAAGVLVDYFSDNERQEQAEREAGLADWIAVGLKPDSSEIAVLLAGSMQRRIERMRAGQ